MLKPQCTLLPDGRRLHLQHGPIDLVIEAFGGDLEVALAYKQAKVRFQTILDELVAELSLLRQPCTPECRFSSSVAQTMQSAILNFDGQFVTPMVAVAGAVAEHILAALLKGRCLRKAYVNNGGDIALYLADDAQFDVGVVSYLNPPKIAGKITVTDTDQINGIATSGRHGRSFSLGIADAVTVLAKTAALADVAATLIANYVNLPDHPNIKRCPANELDPDSDLGARLVTVDVGRLSDADVINALMPAQIYADQLLSQGLIAAASLSLQGEMRVVGKQLINENMAQKELAYA